ncbi:hypothetical protein HDU76_011429 [Blyttiomyces sp. JEL0837]|nr:hypothetical protein HDU76_011429 [Blyttiomyces sp. JEL0837]
MPPGSVILEEGVVHVQKNLKHDGRKHSVRITSIGPKSYFGEEGVIYDQEDQHYSKFTHRAAFHGERDLEDNETAIKDWIYSDVDNHVAARNARKAEKEEEEGVNGKKKAGVVIAVVTSFDVRRGFKDYVKPNWFQDLSDAEAFKLHCDHKDKLAWKKYKRRQMNMI